MMRCIRLFIGCLFSLNIYADKYVIGAQNLAYFPHYDFASSTDKGVAWSILEAFSEASGHEFVYLSLPIRRLQLELVKGNVDFVYPDNRGWYNSITTSNDKYFSLPLTSAVTGTIVKRQNAGKGIEKIKNLAMPLGFTPVNWQERIDTQRTQITWVTDIQQGLALLYQERVDGLDLEYFVSQRSAPLSYEQDAFTLDLTLPHNEIPFSLSTLYHQDIISELNKFISSNPELIDSIKTKYGITPFEQLSQKLLIEQGLKIEEVWK
ncbi:hypothetical protein KUL17_37990 [Alteromonas sp. KUL17]|nr:hypothetical protein KUL49_18940 [Alteromonas sp. KUL17]GEA04902.1 hypothetical protein KUL17_37990 [Alteromonas sp. KUL17]